MEAIVAPHRAVSFFYAISTGLHFDLADIGGVQLGAPSLSPNAGFPRELLNFWNRPA